VHISGRFKGKPRLLSNFAIGNHRAFTGLLHGMSQRPETHVHCAARWGNYEWSIFDANKIIGTIMEFNPFSIQATRAIPKFVPLDVTLTARRDIRGQFFLHPAILLLFWPDCRGRLACRDRALPSGRAWKHCFTWLPLVIGRRPKATSRKLHNYR